jgi:hypothetical protein
LSKFGVRALFEEIAYEHMQALALQRSAHLTRPFFACGTLLEKVL